MSTDTLPIAGERLARAKANLLTDVANDYTTTDAGVPYFTDNCETVVLVKSGIPTALRAMASFWPALAWTASVGITGYLTATYPQFAQDGGYLVVLPLGVALHTAPWAYRRHAFVRLRKRASARYLTRFTRAVEAIVELGRVRSDAFAVAEQIRRIEPGFHELLAEFDTLATALGRPLGPPFDHAPAADTLERCRSTQSRLEDVVARVIAASWVATATARHITVDAPAPSSSSRRTKTISSKLTSERQRQMGQALARLEELTA